MENNCMWHFVQEGGCDIGPNDPINENFKVNPYSSIVREAIQNSLDAVRDSSKPVKVSFKYLAIEKKDYPNLFQLEEYILRCKEYFKKDLNGQRLFNSMLEYLELNQSIDVLRISDYNTTGMEYRDDTSSQFYAFLRSGGVNAKNQSGSGGSFGFGKGAYFELSPIKTVVVSTYTSLGNVYFEGATRLTTHKDKYGVKRTAFGYYDNNGGFPISDNDRIPYYFSRTEIGTDINIIGLWKEADRESHMIRSVLNNFWYAIHEQKLIVEVDQITISSDNLDVIINQYFIDEIEKGSVNDPDSWNPKPYFKAVKLHDKGDSFKLFEDQLETLGNVKLYVYLSNHLSNRIAYFRSPRMVVMKKTRKLINGYSAVFLCDDKKGNELLRSMENPAHSIWDSGNAPKRHGKISKEAISALKELNEFIEESLKSLSNTSNSARLNITGLEDYLFIPEDLVSDSDNPDTTEDGNSNSVLGSRSGMTTDRETGSLTSAIDNLSQEIKEPHLVSVIASKPESGKKSDDGRSGIGGLRKKISDTKNPKPGLGKGQDEPIFEPGKSGEIFRSPIKLKSNVIVQKIDETIKHIIRIVTEKDIQNAEIQLDLGSDNSKRINDSLIDSSSNGLVEGHKLLNVKLIAGVNEITVAFKDNLKHSIKITAYES